MFIAVSTISYSQSKSIFKNKLAIVYDLSYSPKSYLDENDGLRALGIRETLKRTNFENTFTFNYKIMSKLSLSLIAGYHSNGIYNRGNYGGSVSGLEEDLPKISSISYGAGINIFFKKGLAPSDSHLGFYFKKHQYNIKETDVIQASYRGFEDNTHYYDLAATGDMKLNMSFIGVKYVYTRMITKSLPIYWNIGINYTVLIKSDKTYSDISYKEMYGNNTQLNNQTEQNTTFGYYKTLHGFRINLGLGYIF